MKALPLLACVAVFSCAGGGGEQSQADDDGTPGETIDAAGSSGPVIDSAVVDGRGGDDDGFVFVGGGDIAKCTALGLAGIIKDPHELSAELVQAYPPDTPIFTLGDNVYSDGTALEFATCYDRAWGQFKNRTYPSPGNHDYNTDGASGYFDFFGDRAGDSSKGYYSYELAGWKMLALNSNCADVPCDADSEQVAWIREELANSSAKCTMAYWHHPRFASDRAGNNATVEPLYQALYDGDADLILVGHAHNYERFPPLTPQGYVDAERGIRQFVVGNVGSDLRGIEEANPHSEVFYNDSHGIMELTLYPDRYQWRFVPTEGNFSDTGTQLCH